ncbi:unnamed protein product, partial [Ilex paraguariensis]
MIVRGGGVVSIHRRIAPPSSSWCGCGGMLLSFVVVCGAVKDQRLGTLINEEERIQPLESGLDQIG